MNFDEDYSLTDDVTFDDLNYALALIYATIDHCGIEVSDLTASTEDLENLVWASSVWHGEPFIRNIFAFKKMNKIKGNVKEKNICLDEAMKEVLEATTNIATHFIESHRKTNLGLLIKEELNNNAVFSNTDKN